MDMQMFILRSLKIKNDDEVEGQNEDEHKQSEVETVTLMVMRLLLCKRCLKQVTQKGDSVLDVPPQGDVPVSLVVPNLDVLHGDF